MPRCSFLFEYSRSALGQPTVIHRSTYSCIPRIADFLGIKNLQYVADADDKVDRAGYTRPYTKADGTLETLTIPAGQKTYNAYGKANAKTVILKTGANAVGKRRRLTFTFPSYLTVSDIGDALSELLPSAIFPSTAPATPAQIEPFYTIVGGNTYPLKTSTQAEETPFPNLAKTPTEEVAVLRRTRSRRRSSAGPAPTPTPTP